MERREGTLTGIGQILDRNIILKGADVLTVKGYTQVPNHVLISDRLSPGAKLVYAMRNWGKTSGRSGCRAGSADEFRGGGDGCVSGELEPGAEMIPEGDALL